LDFPRASKSVVDLLPSGRTVTGVARRLGGALLITAFTAGATVTAQAAVPPQDTSSIKAAPLVMQQAGTPATMHAQHWSHSSHSSHSSHYSHYSSR
jgi:hypothetical protein